MIIKNNIVQPRTFIKKRCYCLKTSSDKLKSFQHTVFLPKTNFPSQLGPEKIVERDARIQQEAKFLDYYNWQRENLKGEFVLHDGPPYANGKPHIGHAINKILKDIIIRSQTVQGRRVHFVPGWDCHGLPIELVASKKTNENMSPLEIREKAREVALNMSSIQKEAFKQWGVMADWENQCYYTYDTKYVVNELLNLWKIMEKGLIYYDLKPIYWSPSSRTALAEAELVYQNHKSCALYVRMNVIQNSFPEPLYLLVWTTTPWTVPLNKAIYCSPNIKYSIFKISTISGFYIMAKDLIPEFQKKLQLEITIESEISSKELLNFQYKNPWNENEILKVFESSKVEHSGTGLLHSVPGHGHEDYALALENNLKIECFVDENGRYLSNAGKSLSGLNVLKEGSKFVIENLSSEILLQEIYSHSYPYDWRTNEPVIIRASHQWFIDSDQLKERAIKCLEKTEVPIKYFEDKLKNRPYWCLSRQRKWGVPIPAFFHKKSGRPLISKSLVHHICLVIESKGPDAWWTESLETLFPRKFCEEFFVKMEDVTKGEDIMDIWFDSGISWSHALNGKKSEMYLEGEDQYRGWFQSSLLTSVGIQNSAPFKKILTHGFTVDEKGRKMSKSVGNVVDPETIVSGKNAFGVDTLRWFVGSHSHNSIIPVSNRILMGNHNNIKKMRAAVRFILGAISDFQSEKFDTKGLTHLDRFLLNSCHELYHSTMDFYNSQNINKVCLKILYFIPNEVSARYITVIKDRLYCDEIDSIRRRACQYTLSGILDTLCCVLAPILPHLVEEIYSYHPVYCENRKFFFNSNVWTPPSSWKDDSVKSAINLLDELKSLGNLSNEKQRGEMSCCVQADGDEFELLKKMQNGEEKSVDSELTEILQVAEVSLKKGGKGISLSPTNSSRCLRCRRFTANENDDLCKRCSILVS